MSGTTLPTTLEVGESLVVEVKFTPTASGIRNGSLSILSNAPTSPTTISLLGVGSEEGGGLPALKILSTSGNQIVDEDGEQVRLRSINWFGAEGTNYTPHGTWARRYTDLIDLVVEMGFNCIRLPFSGDIIGATPPSPSFNAEQNPEFVGKTALEVFDLILDYCQEKNVYVVLDHHRRTAGVGADGSPVDGSYTVTNWHATWTAMATRYGSHPAVIGADLHNEPHDLDWNTWATYAENCAAVIHAIAPTWLIMVEGVGAYEGVSYWWGGQLAGVRDRPVVLGIPNKLVYSPHEYGQSVSSGQSWLAYEGGSTPSGWPDNLFTKWDEVWGFIFYENIAPLWIGEFGGHFGYDGTGALTKPHTVQERTWLATLCEYLNGDRNGDGDSDSGVENSLGMSFAFWSLNPNSGDTGGLLMDDWVTVQSGKLALLDTLFSDTPLPSNVAEALIDEDSEPLIDEDEEPLEDE